MRLRRRSDRVLFSFVKRMTEEAEMAKRLMVLVGMLAVLLATAVPALAQQFPPGTITVTGVLGEGARGPDGSGVFSITDETTGEGFIIEVGSPIDQYVGERVEINGIPQPQPNAGPRILDIVAFTPVGGGRPAGGRDRHAFVRVDRRGRSSGWYTVLRRTGRGRRTVLRRRGQ